MREIKVNEKTIGVKASSLTLFFYKKEFKSDLIGDIAKLQKDGEITFDSVIFLQIAWALNKSYSYPNEIKPFEPWMIDLGCVSINFYEQVMKEAMNLLLDKRPMGKTKKNVKKK